MNKLKPRTYLAIVVVVCAVVRIGVLLALPSVFAYEQTGQVQGNDAHDKHAVNLVENGVFGLEPGVPDADFPPLYVYVLAGVYRWFGRGHIQVGLIQTLMDCISVVLIYQIAKRLIPRGEGVGVLSGLFYALYPYLIFQNLTLVETPLFILELLTLILVAILLRQRTAWDRGTLLLILLGGLDLGCGLLTRPIIAPLMGFIGLWFLFRRPFVFSLVSLSPVVIIGILVTVPWNVRNYQLFHQVVLISTNSGENIYFGNNQYTVPFIQAGYHPSFIPIDGTVLHLDRVQRSQRLAQMGLDYLHAHPDQIPSLLWEKFIAYWSIDVFPRKNATSGDAPIENYEGQVHVETNAQGQLTLNGVPLNDPLNVYSQPLFDQVGRLVHRLYFGALLILGLIGIGLTFRLWREVSLLWLTLLCMTIIYVAFNPATRYRAPTDPLLFIFSAYAVIYLGHRFRIPGFAGKDQHAEGILPGHPADGDSASSLA